MQNDGIKAMINSMVTAELWATWKQDEILKDLNVKSFT